MLQRTVLGLSPGWHEQALRFPPAIRSLIVDNADPAIFTAGEVLASLDLCGSASDWASRLCDASCVQHVDRILESDQCAVLRAVVDNALDGKATCEMADDSVDGEPDFQVELGRERLEALIGEAPVKALWDLFLVMSKEPHEIFVRRYSADTRPWFPFHHDRSSLTVNVALTDDSEHVGGRLLVVMDGRVSALPRSEGSATVHPSSLLHAVTRLVSGLRYSLILFSGAICPSAKHQLTLLNSTAMRALYKDDEGCYHCDSCGTDAISLGFPPMWHCSEGCEFDLCERCAMAAEAGEEVDRPQREARSATTESKLK